MTQEIEKQVRIHDRISRVRWAGALMEVFGLNCAVKKTRDGRADGRTDRRTDPIIELLVCE